MTIDLGFDLFGLNRMHDRAGAQTVSRASDEQLGVPVKRRGSRLTIDAASAAERSS